MPVDSNTLLLDVMYKDRLVRLQITPGTADDELVIKIVPKPVKGKNIKPKFSVADECEYDDERYGCCSTKSDVEEDDMAPPPPPKVSRLVKPV